MSSTIEEIRARSHKIVTLPSGLVVEIRKVWLIDFFDMGELFTVLPAAESEEPNKRNEPNKPNDPALGLKLKAQEDKYLARAIVKGAVEPRFSEDEGVENAVWIKDLSYEDFCYLGNAILAWAGVGREVAADADKFRPDTVGKNGERPGGEVREAADGDPADGARGILSESRGDFPGDREPEKKA